MKDVVRLIPLPHAFWEQFIDAGDVLSRELNVSRNLYKATSSVYREGRHYKIYYEFRVKQSVPPRPHFFFSVNFLLTPRSRCWEAVTISANLAVSREEIAPDFEFKQDLTTLLELPNLLSRWVIFALHKYNARYNSIRLEDTFGIGPIRVYGVPYDTWHTWVEMRFLTKALKEIGGELTGEVLIYRFRHVNVALERTYSYAIWVSTDTDPGVWVFFYEAALPDTDLVPDIFHDMETWINELGNRAKMRSIDLPSDDLKRFLLKNSDGFETVCASGHPGRFYPEIVVRYSQRHLDRDFVVSLRKMQDAIDREDYPDALRRMRVVIQDSMLRMFRQRSMEVGDRRDPDVCSMASKLISMGALDGRLSPWFQAFTSIANLAAHSEYPTQDELRSFVMRERILTTFAIGYQLLAEILNTPGKIAKHSEK